MAHCAKYTRAACGHMFKHYERAKDESGQYIKFGNQDIDTTKTHLNYNLGPERNMTQGEFVKKRCSEVYCLSRKDVNVMCSWVITLPKEIQNQEDTKFFFQKTYEFLENRYGRENVVSAFVHMDEKTPHMHFAFVPVIYDAKKGRYKVSAKECISRTELSRFHEDLQNYFDQTYLSCKILNEATKEGNKSILELKRGTAIQEVQKAQIELLKAKSELNIVKSELQEEMGKLEEIRKINTMTLDNVVEHKTITGKIKKVTMPVETYQVCLNAQQRAEAAETELRWTKKELNNLKASTNLQRVQELTRENQKLKIENKELISEIKKVNKILHAFPDIREVFVEAFKVLFQHGKSKDGPEIER